MKTTANKNRIVYIENGNLFVFSKGKTSNKKIALPNETIIQTYTFSLDQYHLANNGEKITMNSFFSLDSSNCLDCPFSQNQRNKTGNREKCYTHKLMQYSGFLSMLRSIKPDELTGLTEEKKKDIINLCKGLYVRFGTYGEPSLINYNLVKAISETAKSFTGYTHQYQKDFAKLFSNYFMASVHSQKESETAKVNFNFRSFIASSDNSNSIGVNCPASEEKGFITNCSKCGLCSGNLGKGQRNVFINLH